MRVVESELINENLTNKSYIPTMIVNTDELNWDGYAKMILDKIR
jgi:hypothetical protein